MEEQVRALTDEKEKMEANEWSLKQNLEVQGTFVYCR